VHFFLYWLGAAIPVDNQPAEEVFPEPSDAQKAFNQTIKHLELLERSDFNKLLAICNAQRRLVLAETILTGFFDNMKTISLYLRSDKMA
jgi:hypothetical protein